MDHRIDRYSLPVCLIAQGLLLFCRLDLLPVWGDEQFTLDTSTQGLGKIAEILRGDIHPPLYYFLMHYWLGAGWPVEPIVIARAFSGIAALAATVVLYRLWLPAEGRWRFLLPWTLSPCLILYGRMARSYTLQLLLGSLALYWGLDLIRDPRSKKALVLYSLAGAALLYTHYLPALAIAGAVQILLVYRLIRRGDNWAAATGPAAIMLVLYTPWLMTLRFAVERAARAESYQVAGNALLEQVIRLGYLAVSFTVGETAPVWVMAGGGLATGLFLFRGRGKRADWFGVVLIAAAIGYAGATRWVSFAFIPARILFVLPFYLMWLSRRTWICVTLACLSIGSLNSYYRGQDFFNKGYLLPFDRIADIIEQRSGGRPARVIVRAQGLDVSPLTRRLRLPTAAWAGAEIIWVLDNRDDRTAPAGTRALWRGDFVPYSGMDRAAMKLLNWPSRPSHVLQLTEYGASGKNLAEESR